MLAQDTDPILHTAPESLRIRPGTSWISLSQPLGDGLLGSPKGFHDSKRSIPWGKTIRPIRGQPKLSAPPKLHPALPGIVPSATNGAGGVSGMADGPRFNRRPAGWKPGLAD